MNVFSGCNSDGRVSASQAEGRGFESRHPLTDKFATQNLQGDSCHNIFDLPSLIFTKIS